MPGELAAQLVAAGAKTPLAGSTALMTPIETPLVFSGFTAETLNAYEPLLRQMGITAVQGGSSATTLTAKPAAGWERALNPGEAGSAGVEKPDPKIIADPRTNALIVYAVESDLNQIKRLVAAGVEVATSNADPESSASAMHPGASPAALESLMTALEFRGRRTPEDLAMAIEAAGRATTLDPAYLPAWTTLAELHLYDGMRWYRPPLEALGDARKAEIGRAHV